MSDTRSEAYIAPALHLALPRTCDNALGRNNPDVLPLVKEIFIFHLTYRILDARIPY